MKRNKGGGEMDLTYVPKRSESSVQPRETDTERKNEFNVVESLGKNPFLCDDLNRSPGSKCTRLRFACQAVKRRQEADFYKDEQQLLLLACSFMRIPA